MDWDQFVLGFPREALTYTKLRRDFAHVGEKLLLGLNFFALPRKDFFFCQKKK